MRPLEAQLAINWPPERWAERRTILAVSGGPDSVALARAMQELASANRSKLALAHFNHQLRGSEADADEQFVAESGRDWNLPVIVGRRDPHTPARGPDGVEAAARQQRYEFLLTTAEQWGAHHVVMAHTADDQAETVLHRILRGTGIAGLAGMPAFRQLSESVTLARPLLTVRRAEVLSYLGELGQAYCVDASNQRLDYTRNRLRLDLLPKLKAEYNPRVVEALIRLGQLAQEAQDSIESRVGQVAAVAVKQPANEAGAVTIDCRALERYSRHLIREVFVHTWRHRGWPEQSMGFAHWERLADLCGSEPPRWEETFPGAIQARRRGGTLFLEPTSRSVSAD